MEHTSNSNDIHWSWILVVFLLVIVLLIVFGDTLTFIVGAISLTAIAASYYSGLHKHI